MALSIKDPEADRLARELAKRTGQTMTQVIVGALREKLAKTKARPKPDLAQALVQIGRRCAALPVKDKRRPEEILGYDDHGAPR